MTPIMAITIATASVFQVLLIFAINGLSIAWFIEDIATETPAIKRAKPISNINRAKVLLFISNFSSLFELFYVMQI